MDQGCLVAKAITYQGVLSLGPVNQERPFPAYLPPHSQKKDPKATQPSQSQATFPGHLGAEFSDDSHCVALALLRDLSPECWIKGMHLFIYIYILLDLFILCAVSIVKPFKWKVNDDT
jgi:hypothetical protein